MATLTKTFYKVSKLRTVGLCHGVFETYTGISSLTEVSSFARDKGITLALENHGNLCAKSDQILDLLNKVDSSNLKLNLDIGNFLGVNEDPVSSVRRLAQKEKGYQGYLSLEYEAKIDSKIGVEKGLDVLRKSLQKISLL